MFFLRFLRDRLGIIALFLSFSLIFAAVFALYSLPLAAVAYPAALCALFGIIYMGVDFYRARRRHAALSLSVEDIECAPSLLPPAETVTEEDYRRLISLVAEANAKIVSEVEAKYADMLEYYTVWAHEIKTPIASMRLSLDGEDSERSRRLSEDLQRIEEYVGMVMTFLRLDSDATDYVFRKCPLDEIIRSAIRKYRTMFIRRHIAIDYVPTDAVIVTDEKWLSFVIEQLISNAIKYTREGGVTVTVGDADGEVTLTVGDTGIGIAPEDLPRIFERGYTGYNGRTDKKASGIGLYLCRRVCGRLGYAISADSEPGAGTKVTVSIPRERITVE